jgi:hypothetical protein
VSRDTVDVYDVTLNIVGPHHSDRLPCGDAQRQDVHVELFLPLLSVTFCQQTLFHVAGVVDQDVDRS